MLPELIGCYQSEKLAKMGRSGASGRAFTQYLNWLAMRLDDTHMLVFPLNDQNLPMPLQRAVPTRDFLSHYLPAPQLFNDKLAAAALALIRLLRKAQEPIEEKKLPEAERTLFTVILVALAVAGEPDQDSSVLDVLELADAATSGGEAQKLSINAFGIQLRKQKAFDAAIAYYKIALELSPGDERLMFNMARALFEKGDLAACQQKLEQAISINANFPEAHMFLRYVKDPRKGSKSGKVPDFSL